MSLLVLLVALVGPRVALGDLAEPAFHAPTPIGVLGPAGTDEISGMVPLSRYDDHFWMHNDWSDRANARVFAVHQSGTVIAEVMIAGATNTDWEDCAVGPGPDPGVSYLYLADTGTNRDGRPVVSIWRVPEPHLPSLAPGQQLASEQAEEIRVRYPTDVRNIEAMILDPAGGTPYLLSKLADITEVYRVPDVPGDDGVHLAVLVASIQVSGLVTGASVSPGGERLLIRTYTQVVLLERVADVPFEDIFLSTPCAVPSPTEPQGESITWDAEGRDYLTVGEGSAVPIYRMFTKVAHEICSVDLPSASPLRFVRGNVADEDGTEDRSAINVTDVAAIVRSLEGQELEGCLDRADSNDDGEVNEADVDELLVALVRGQTLAAPFVEAGIDPTLDELACNESSGIELVPEAAEWSYWYSDAAPAIDWQDPDTELADWPRGPGGIGVGHDDLGTVTPEPVSSVPALYARSEFFGSEVGELDRIALDIDYAHGFVAYLNGLEVARARLGEAGFEVPRELRATHHPGGRHETYLVCRDLLDDERNALAIEVHARQPWDSRLYVRALLRTFQESADSNGEPVEGEETARLYLAADDGLLLGDQLKVRVLLESSVPVWGASWFLEHDAGLKILAVDVPEVWGDQVWAESRINRFAHTAAQVVVVAPHAVPLDTTEPREPIELAILTYEFTTTSDVPVEMRFGERSSNGPTLANIVTVEDLRSVIPETIDLALKPLAPFRRGDCNDDGRVDISDAVSTLGFLFLGEEDPDCDDACDSNDDGNVDISDAIAILEVLFLGNGIIPLPGMMECGVDPGEDEVGCDTYETCR